jgi:hypothetical protein
MLNFDKENRPVPYFTDLNIISRNEQQFLMYPKYYVDKYIECNDCIFSFKDKEIKNKPDKNS